MKKSFNIILFTILSSLALFILSYTLIMKVEGGQNTIVDLFVFKTNNPFVLILIFTIPLFYAFVYFLYKSFSEERIVVESRDENGVKSVQQVLEEEIENRYQSRIEDIQMKIVNKFVDETDRLKILEKALWGFCSELDLSQGLIYGFVRNTDPIEFELLATYAFFGDLTRINRFEMKVGLNGQIAYSGEAVMIKDVPKEYTKVISGLGESHPNLLVIIPIKDEENGVVGLVEVSGFGAINKKELQTICQICQATFSNILK